MAVAGGLSVGPPFGTGLILMVLPLLLGMSVFGVEFAIHQTKRPQITEFNADGLRFHGPNITPVSFLWKDLSRIHVRSVGNRKAPAVLVFVLRRRLLIRLVPIDFRKDAAVAERVAAFIARYAANVRRTGNTEILRWEPSLAVDGDTTIVASRFQPEYYGGVAVFGPLMNVYFAYVAVAYGYVQDRGIGWAMIGAYLVLGTAVVGYCWRCARRSRAFAPAAHQGVVVTGLLIGGVVLALSQLLLGFLFLT